MRRKDAERWLMRFLEPLSAASTPAAIVRVQTCLPTQCMAFGNHPDTLRSAGSFMVPESVHYA